MTEKFYKMDLNQIYKEFETNPNNGLSQEEVTQRLEKYGYNELPKVSKGFIKIYLAPLFNWLIVIYLVGALILFIASFFGGSKNTLFISLTLGIVGLNCLVAIVQQYRATKKLEALKELSAPTTTVVREGVKKEISTKEVVLGDLLSLKQGDKIPADARLINSSNLEVNEASLTGESEPIKKISNEKVLNNEDLPIADRKNMVFYGTYITTGNGKAIAVKTGPNTEIGKISQSLEAAGTSEIPIRKKMNNFGKWLGLAVVVFWFITLIIVWVGSGFLRLNFVKSLNSALDILPLNIPLLVTIVLLTGVLVMARKGVIIRNLASVDSLGRVSVVCSDKTGTMTKNQMSVQFIWSNGSIFKVTGSGYTPEGNVILMDDPKNPEFVKHIEDFPHLKLLILGGFLNNNSALVKSEVRTGRRASKIIDTWKVIGSPTEGALVVLFQKIMGDYLLEGYEEIKEFPFDSSLKRMTKIYQKEEKFYSFTKGATEIILPLCSKIVYNGTEVELTEEKRNEVLKNVNEYANQGYRILSLCYKDYFMLPPHSDDDRENFESEMVYNGFVTILDPPREGVRQSVEQCHEAGIDIVMITGDSPATAKAIASQIAIIKNESDLVVEGKDIENVKSWDDFKRIKVFARVSPKHKENIIKRYQEKKRVVAMTGDGVNDTLALNMADAGLAMGIQGTDVAKEAADMVISDDSFNSIVTGIHQGRGIFSKIRAVVFFYICINLFEGIVQFILAVILDLPYFLDQEFYLQWIFLAITLHSLPGLILTFDTISNDVMKYKPRDSEEILSKRIVYLLLIFGGLLTISMLVTYFITITGAYPVFPENHNFGPLNNYYLYSGAVSPVTLRIAKTLTMLMVTLFFCESFLVFQIRRPNKSLLKSLIEDRNKFMFYLTGLLFALFIMLMYIPNVQVYLANAGFNFSFMFLTGLDWFICFLISLICIGSFEGIKFLARKKGITF
ncbi:MAG: cation-transporting P-type ATPase [Candidatus Lokiarchaeota archaeon]